MKSFHYFMINLLLAILWIILNREADIYQFFLGFGVGFLILWAFQYLLKTAPYIRVVKGFALFIVKFGWLFLKANFSMLWIILFVPKKKLHPTFVCYLISDLSHFESLILSQLFTLTPGSVSVDLEKRTLLVHVIDQQSHDQSMKDLITLENLIKGFTR